MRFPWFAAVAVAILTGASATASPADVTQRNTEWLLDALGFDAVPDGSATVHRNGESWTMSAAEALRESALRFGDVDAAAVVAAASAGGEPWGVGDVWVIEWGYHDGCGRIDFTTLESGVLPESSAHPQLATYEGVVGVAQSNHPDRYWRDGIVLDWSTKGATGGAYSGGQVEFGGESDFYCQNFFGTYLLWPKIDGFARHLPEESS